MTTAAPVKAPVFHNRLDKPVITVIGDRQAGKSYLSMLYAICEACLGNRVLYVCFDGSVARFRMEEAAELAERLGMEISRVSRVNGDYRIFFPSGGQAFFRPQSRKAYIKPFDRMVIDDDVKESPHLADQVVRVISATY